MSWSDISPPPKWGNAPAPSGLLCISSLDLLRLSLIHQKGNPQRERKGILVFEPTNVFQVPEPAQGKGRDCIVRSMVRGMESQELPFLVVGRRQISSAAHGTTPLIHLHSSWCHSQEWLKQLLSLLRLNLLSFGHGGLNGCDLQPDVLQYRSAELGFLSYSGCEGWWVGCGCVSI